MFTNIIFNKTSSNTNIHQDFPLNTNTPQQLHQTPTFPIQHQQQTLFSNSDSNILYKAPSNTNILHQILPNQHSQTPSNINVHQTTAFSTKHQQIPTLCFTYYDRLLNTSIIYKMPTFIIKLTSTLTSKPIKHQYSLSNTIAYC